MKRINPESNITSKRHHNPLYYNPLSYALILATTASMIMGLLESLPKLQKGYTQQEIELQIKEQRGAFAYLTHPGRLATYKLYSLYKQRENLYDDSLTQIINETPLH